MVGTLRSGALCLRGQNGESFLSVHKTMFLDIALFPKRQIAMAPEHSGESATLWSGNKIPEEAVCIANGPKSPSTPFVEEQDKLARFEQHIMPHMDAAYNLARWLTSNDSDAQDVVQESYLRAFKYFGGFSGRDSRGWLLRIVRNAFYDWLKQNRGDKTGEPFDEEMHSVLDETQGPDGPLLLEKADHEVLHKAIASLPLEFREILVLRELEGFSYNEISQLANIPLGTVMSRLARGRERLRTQLIGFIQKEGK
jgi:RNA polymerase sigma-70 factor (ECF subfamily)